jgi:hypothetical protein
MDTQFGDQIVQHVLADEIPENRRLTRGSLSLGRRRSSVNKGDDILIDKSKFQEARENGAEVVYRECGVKVREIWSTPARSNGWRIDSSAG